jgi:glycine/betaine/sarcosine/D-proline reductase family selenoprotein B
LASTRPPIDYIARTTDQYSALGYPAYRWVENEEPSPWREPQKPLSASRLGLVASGGIYVAGQIAFHWKDDLSLRLIDRDTPISELRATHFAYDVTDARSDPNVVFPLETLRGLEREGLIGELGARAYSFMGGIYSSRSVREVLAPALIERLLEDDVDRVLLVPV